MILAILGATIMMSPDLPVGSSPKPVAVPYFPDRMHAFVWRNWSVSPLERMAKVVGAKPSDIKRMGMAMGLPEPPTIGADQLRRSYITVIRRNWHLLPYSQLLTLLGWDSAKLAYTLREDDFLYVKLGNLKPDCEPLKYSPPTEAALTREKEIAAIVKQATQSDSEESLDPLFGFVKALSTPPTGSHTSDIKSKFTPRFCYSYFALYGDPLLEKGVDPYPDGYLARMSEAGVDGVWLQGVLYKLAPFPWDAKLSDRCDERLAALRKLTERAKRRGIGVWLYMNEPRAMPLEFFKDHPELKGVVEGDRAALCTSSPDVQNYIRNSIERICRQVPDLAGFFTISGSENLTNCWSHYGGAACPRCGKRKPEEVIAELNALIQEGIDKSGSGARLVAWDWGWQDGWVEGIVQRLPEKVSVMSVSEWSIPIDRGGIKSEIGEYSISTIGPGPRATRTWELARKRHMRDLAKIQAGNSWELSSVPYIPAVANVAAHIRNLREAGVNGIMLGWTLGGYPSPNLEVVSVMTSAGSPSPDEAMLTVAEKRFGAKIAPDVVKAWKRMSTAFQEFPFHPGTVYQAPLQMGPANPLWSEPTRYASTMVGFPYDDVNGWRSVYPPEIFASQLEKVSAGFDEAVAELSARSIEVDNLTNEQKKNLGDEIDVATAAAIHFRSVASQTRFVVSRDALTSAKTAGDAAPLINELKRLINGEMEDAVNLRAIQRRDSRIGFEATNHYFYVPDDLLEKVVNCRYLLDTWLPEQERRFRL